MIHKFDSQCRKNWEVNYKFVSLCGKLNCEKRITILSHRGVKLEIWLTVLYQSGKKFEKWHTNLTNCVESFVAKKNHNFVSQCGNVCDLNHNLVPQIEKWSWILSLSVEMFVRCFTILYHGAENFSRWSWISYNHVEITVRWFTVLCRSAITSWDLKNKFVSQFRKFCGRNITNFSPNVELFVKRFKKMHHSPKSFDIWITSLSHSVEKLDKWSEILSCNLQTSVMLITILYTVPTTLTSDLQFCLTTQNSLSGDLTFCTTKPKSFRGYH